MRSSRSRRRGKGSEQERGRNGMGNSNASGSDAFDGTGDGENGVTVTTLYDADAKDEAKDDEGARIDTLIPYKATTFRPQKKLGKLDLSSTPWAISAKLGRFLLSGVDEETTAKVTRELAAYLTEAPSECIHDYEPGTDDLMDYIIKENPGATCLVEDDNDDGFVSKYIITGPKLKAKYCGDHKWYWRSGRGGMLPVLGFKTATALGAIEICGADDKHRDLVRTVVSETTMKHQWNGYFRNSPSQIRYEFNDAATNRWDDETNREANRRYADPKHTATVFEDKKNCDDRHKAAAANGYIPSMFKHVEIDDDVDLDVYARMQDEFKKRWNDGELPQIDPSVHSLRFRKTGRHHAIGVYCDALKGIAVDPRAPKSLLHEFSHAYDYGNEQLSCSDGFRPILRAFRDNFDTEGLSDTQIRYYDTPTEVFARSWEVYAATHGKGGSFVKTVDEMKDDAAYKPLFHIKGLNEYFDKLSDQGQGKRQAKR
jgi:hypothetical protein